MKLNKNGYRLLFGMGWAVYCSSYFCRLNYTAVMGELIGNVIDKTQAGWVQTCFLVAYASGQVISGLLADRVSPRIFVTLSAIGGGIMNIVFAFARSFEQMAVLRFATGLFMSMLWPSLYCAAARYMTVKDQTRWSIGIASSISVGTLLSYGTNAVVLKWMSWSWAFILPGVLMCAIGIACYLLFPRMKSFAVVSNEIGHVQVEKEITQLSIGRLIFIPCILVAIIPTAFHGVIKDGVTAWIPAYICEVHNQSPAFSSLLSMLLPIFNLAGAYMAKYAYAKAKNNVFTGSAVFFALSLLCLGIMLAGAQTLLVPTIICFALITSFMMAVNVMLINLLPLCFEQYGRAATVSGGLNAIAYGGSALASGLIGVISERYGWAATVSSWLFMMAIAFAVCFVFRTARRTPKEHAASRM